ncbi:MAG: hypothetical protein ACE5JR_11890, partial [Gemmatimonadota bacterium]
MAGPLLYISFWHPSGGGPGTHRTARLSRNLKAAGWEVIVLCGRSHGQDHPHRVNDVRVLPAYSPFPRGRPGTGRGTDARKGPAPWISAARSLIRQAVFFPDPQVYWTPFGWATAVKSLAGRPPAALFCSGPPFSPYLLGWLLKLWWRRPLVLDYRDVWLGHPWWP